MEWRDLWRTLAPRRAIESDVRDEISFHIEERIRELVRSGWSEERARAEILERFGDVETVERACRSYDRQRVAGQSWRMTMEGWVRDTRLAMRTLRRELGFTSMVVVTLALGIGATAAVFSVVEGILLRPLPFPDAGRLAVVWQNDRATGTMREGSSVPDYYDYVERSRAFEELAMFGLGTAVLDREGAPPLQLDAASVSSNLVGVLELEMQLGRPFTLEEDSPGGADVVILTDRVWVDLFAADPAIVGRSVTIDDRPHEVVGVLPPGIDYPAGETDVWLTVKQSATTSPRSSHWVTVVGRLADGVEIGAAQAEMSAIMADLEIEYASDNVNRGAFVEALGDVGRGDVRTTLWVLFGAVLAVLAIACVNVANLLLARGGGRLRELAVLEALGASVGLITRRFFVESALLTSAACALGAVLAWLGVDALTALAPANLRVLGTPTVNRAVLAFTVGVAGVICLVFGLLPTVQARRVDLQRQLKEGRTSAGATAGLTLRRLLVAAQLALAVVLMLGATLLASTVSNLQSVDPGFVAESTVRVDFALPDSRIPSFESYPNWPSVFAFLQELEGEVQAIPGVRSASVLLNHPLDPGFTNSFRIEGQPYDPSQGEMTTRLVTPGYFETAGVELLRGRILDEADRAETPDVILLNQAAVDRYFPDVDPIGQRIGFWGLTFREVVGIVANERIHGLTAEPPPAMYVSMYQAPPRGGKLTLMARTDVAPLSIVDGVRAAMGRVDAGVPVFNVATMEATVAEAMVRERFASTVLGVFSAISVLLAMLGVHGVLAYLVSQRGQEVGVRMALGADRGRVVGMIVRQGVTMAALGVLVGLVVAGSLSGLLDSLLYGVSATAPWVYVIVAVSMGSVAMAATALPAWKAASIDPVTSLRGS